MKKSHTNLLLLTVAVLLIVSPLFILKHAKFTGTDDQAKKVISEIAPDYKPWTKNGWKPQSGEMESFLFAAQAGIGSFIVGYVLGFGRGKKQVKDADKNHA